MAKSEILVSIVIPVFNRENLFKKSIESVLSQSYSFLECVVVDDGSTDNTWDHLVSFSLLDPRIRPIKRTNEPKGAASCRNIGWRNAKSDYIIFLDSDDIMAPWCVEERLAFMQANPNLQFAVFPALELINNTVRPDCRLRSLVNTPDPLHSFLSFQPTWCTLSPIWHRQLLQNINGWNENSLAWQDVEIHIRALLNTKQFSWGTSTPDMFIHVATPNSITSQNNMVKTLNIISTRFDIYNRIVDTNDQDFFKKMISIWLFNIVERLSFDENKQLLQFLFRSPSFAVSKLNLFLLIVYTFLFQSTKQIPVIRFLVYKIRSTDLVFPIRQAFYNQKPTLGSTLYAELKKKLQLYNSPFLSWGQN